MKAPAKAGVILLLLLGGCLATAPHGEPAHGGGDAEDENPCESLPASEDPLTTCFHEQCVAPATKESTNTCLQEVGSALDLTACIGERCMCIARLLPTASWNCTSGSCSEPCDDCDCFKLTNQNGDSCQSEYRVCEARVIKDKLDELKMVDHCGHSEVAECVENKLSEANCAAEYAACDVVVCQSANVVEDIITSDPITCKEVLGATEEDHGNCHEHAHEAPFNILVLAVIIAVGNLCRYYGSTFPLSKIPYTVQMFLLGGGWGALCKNIGGDMLRYGELGEIDPHLMFFIFLPILIFESAFATDYHVFKKVKVHCIMLAGPGLIICTGLSAAVAKGFFSEYNWGWVACLLFGCMLSATDPVAVVALLKELGAAPEISQLIEGESLLNDGTAIVFFNILKDSVAAGVIEMSIFEILRTLLWVAGGGCVLGWIVGVITKNCIKAVFNDPEIEITMTLVAAYVTFFVAEEYLKVSGVLGLVVMGMYIAYHAHVISPEVEHTLHHFWEIIVYMGNTMIFAIAGMVITEKALDNLHTYDFVYLLVNYVILNIVRGFALAVLLVPMNKFGTYQLDWRNACLCCWGGLRGAVGLALALIIAGDTSISCGGEDPKPLLGLRFLFHVAGIVVLTLCVNGVTTGFVVGKLGLDKIAEDRVRNMGRAYKELMKNSDDELYQLRRQHVFRDANWTEVKRWVHNGLHDPYNKDGVIMEPPDVVHDACEHYYRAFHEAIEHEYESGTMLPSSLRALFEFLADVEDHAHAGHFDMIKAAELNQQFKLSLWDEKSPFGGYQNRWMRAFDVGIGFLNCHARVLQSIDGTCHSSQAANKVKEHCKRERQEAIRILEEHSSQRPEIAMALKSRNAARGILNQARHFMQNQIHHSKIGKADAGLLCGMIEANMKQLKHMPPSLSPEDTDRTLVEMCPWYTACPPAHSALRGKYGVVPFLLGDPLLGKEQDGQGCYVILSGVVRVHIGNRAETYGPGYSAGLISILTGKLGKYSEVFAETPVKAAFFSTRLIREQCQQHVPFSAAIWDDCCKAVARKIMTCLPSYRDWSHVKIKNFAEKGKRRPVSDSPAYPTPVPQDAVCILVNGDFKDVLQGKTAGSGPCVVPPSLNSALFSTNAVLFVINNPLSVSEKARKHWSKIRNKIFTVRAIACLQGHEAGLRAVREVLAGRITGLMMAPGAAHEQPRPDYAHVHGRGSVHESNSPRSLMPAMSPMSPHAQANADHAFPRNGYSTARPDSFHSPYSNGNGYSSGKRGSRQLSRSRHTPQSENIEMSEVPRSGSRVHSPSFGAPPTEATPWFSQTEKGAQVHRSRKGTTSPDSQKGGEDLQAPLLMPQYQSQDQISNQSF
ncbi:Sodium/hydrogen exchanger 7 [Diplonema papillatum]|nr:Sodium/hydrogen exchanger 7 [Diplonema papillatum]